MDYMLPKIVPMRAHTWSKANATLNGDGLETKDHH